MSSFEVVAAAPAVPSTSPSTRPPRLPRQPTHLPADSPTNPLSPWQQCPRTHSVGCGGYVGILRGEPCELLPKDSRARNKIKCYSAASCSCPRVENWQLSTGGRERDETELVQNPDESKFKQDYVTIVVYLPRGAHLESHCWQLCSWKVDTVSGYWSIDWRAWSKEGGIKPTTLSTAVPPEP